MRRLILACSLLIAAGVAAGLVLTHHTAFKPAVATTCPAGLHLSGSDAGENAGGEEADAERAREEANPAANLCVPEIEGPQQVTRASGARRMRETGGMPGVRPGALAAAVRERDRLKAQASQLRVPGSGGEWTPKGSGPLLANDASYDVSKEGLPHVNGRINDYAYDEAHHRVFAAVGYGGVWTSDDIGQTWRSVGDGLATQIVASVAYSTAGGGTLIALTGEQNNGGNSYSGLGAYRTTDGGRTWQHSKGLPSGAIGFKVAVDPTDPKVVYAATGFGLYRSTDAAATFANVDLPTGDCHGETFARKNCFLANVVSDVVVQAPDGFGHKGGAVVAAVGWRAGGSPYRDGSPQAPGNGIYGSDNGAPGSFKKLAATGFAPQNRIGRTELGLAIGPKQNHDYLYAEVQDAQLLNGGVPGIDVPEPVKGNNVYRPTNFNGIYVSADFGKTWTQMMSTQDVDRPDSGSALVPVGAVPVVGSYLPGVQSWYNEWVAIDPTVQSADGIPTRMSFGLEEVWQNSGTTTPLTGQTQFHVIGRYYAGEVCQLGLVPTVPGVIPCPTSPTPTNTTTHPDQHGAIWIPDGKGGVTLLVGNDGGAFAQHAAKDELMDNTKWGEGRNEDMHTLLPYDAVMAKDGTITAGLQDNGQLKISPSGRQSMIYGGDAFYSAIDPDNSDVIYEEYTYGIMKVTRDGGHTWRSMSTSDEANGNGALFAAPFRMDPLNPNHIVAGGARVMETTAGPDTSSADQADVGSTPVSSTGYDPNAPQWQNVWDLGSNPDGDGFQISAMDVRGDTSYVGACGRCDVLSAGTFNNKLATNVGGDAPPKAGTPAGWHDAKAAGLPQRIINGIAMDPADPKTVYVTLGAYSRRWLPPGALGDDAAKVGTGHVFKSTDAGATFTDITGNLPDASAEAVLVHGDQIVVSTDVGVFTSPTKNGKTWAPLGTGLPNAPVVSMHMVPDDPGTLIAATFGRGVYTYRFADPSAGGPGNCVDVTKPVGAVSKLKRSPGRRFAVRGTASDRGCGASGRGVVKRVRVALVRVVGKRCRYLSVKGRLGHSTSCTKVRLLKARGTTHWVLKLQRHPPHGRYRVIVQVTDSAGNVGTRRKKLVFRH